MLLHRGRQTIKNAGESESAYRARLFSRAPGFWAGGGAVSALLLIQAGLVFWTWRRLRELGHMRERLSRLADGLALLTDTTEAGLAAI